METVEKPWVVIKLFMPSPRWGTSRSPAWACAFLFLCLSRPWLPWAQVDPQVARGVANGVLTGTEEIEHGLLEDLEDHGDTHREDGGRGRSMSKRQNDMGKDSIGSLMVRLALPAPVAVG